MVVDDKYHHAAHFHFLPYVVGILGEGSVPRKGQYLPLQDPDALTQETIVAVEDICRQATPAFLCRKGWAEIEYIDARGRQRRGRIWQTLRECEPLAYTTSSIETLLTVYNMSRAPGRDQLLADQPSPGDPPICGGSGCLGDQLVHHIAFVHFSQMVPILNKSQTAFFGGNPLNAMARFDAFDWTLSTSDLLSGPVVQWLPWLGRNWLRLWLKLEPTRWRQGHTVFRLFNERQHDCFAAWIERAAAIERPDLLGTLVFYFKQLFEENGDSWKKQFENLTHDIPLRHRQRFAESWAMALEPASQIGRVYNDTRGIHPVDREPAQQLFMETFTAYDFDQTISSIESHREELLPSIG